MTVGTARTVALVGLDAVDVLVEAHVSAGLPGFAVIGSSGTAAREATERVRTALLTVDAGLARVKVLVSLAPADLPKAGARYDLAMATAVLAQREVVPAAGLERTAFIGELALDGAVRPVPGVLPSAHHLLSSDVECLVVAEANAREAASALSVAGPSGAPAGLRVVGVSTLAHLVALLRGTTEALTAVDPPITASPAAAPSSREADRQVPDLADVHGQPLARRALEIAAAGGHHLLLLGPPGCGKSMLAARLPGLLPGLDDADALELAAIRSVAGVIDGVDVLDRCPPFQAPHHTVSTAALLGGGSGVARPGQVSLASGGVLFLDELFEWPRGVLEALREPLEDGVVRVARSRATVRYPARFQLVCAANPCPCGGRDCACPPEVVWRYRAKLSGPLADRLDLAPKVEPLRAADLQAPQGESSAVVAARVGRARASSIARDGTISARVPAAVLRRQLTSRAAAALGGAVEVGDLTGRGYDRCLRVARTIADLAGETEVDVDHVDEALLHRLALLDARGAALPAAGGTAAPERATA